MVRQRIHIRLRFAKLGVGQFLSHLDVLRVFERAMRRAGVSIAYSGGFRRRPKMVFAQALPVGVTSEVELLEIELRERMSPQDLLKRINCEMPDGFEVLDAWEVVEGREPKIGSLSVAEYRLELQVDKGKSPEKAMSKLLEKSKIEVVRSGPKGSKVVNIRPFLMGLEVIGFKGDVLSLKLRSKVGSSGGLRPQEVIGLLAENIGLIKVKGIHRTALTQILR